MTEKRLLALTEEEKDPSVYPSSISGSTPSQSEEEDEIGGNGEGEGSSCRATKRPSANKGFRAVELPPPPVSSSPQASPLNPQWGDRNLPSKGVRSSSRPSPHQCPSRNTKEANRLPPLRNAVEDGAQISQAGGQAVETPTRAQCVKMKATTDVTGTQNLTRNSTSQGEREARQGLPRTSAVEHSKQDGSQGRKTKDQEETPKAIEHSSHAIVGQLFNRTQLIRNNVHSAYNKCGKQGGIQEGELKSLKKVKTVWKDALKGMDEGQDGHKILAVGQIVGQSAPKLTWSGCGELNVDHAEQIRGQPRIQDNRGSEDNSNKAVLGCQGREMTSHEDSLRKQDSQEHTHLECEKEDGGHREGVQDQYHFQSIRKGAKCKSTVAAIQIGNVNPSGQMLSRQGSPTLAAFRAGNEPNIQIAKAESEKQSQLNGKQPKTVTVKDNSPVKTTLSYAGKRPLQKQLALARQDGQPSAGPPRSESDPARVEPSRGSGQWLTSSDPSGTGVLKCKLSGRDLEPPPNSTFSVPESPSSSISTDLQTSQKSPQLLRDQSTVAPCVEDLPCDEQTLHPVLIPSSVVIMVETIEGSSGPSRDHIPGPTSPNVVPASAPPVPQRASHRHGNDEPNRESEPSNLPSPQSHNSARDMKILSKAEDGSVVQKVTVANGQLPGFPDANLGEILKHRARGVEEEDEELSGFSSLLASKLSLSPHKHRRLPVDQGVPQPSLPTDPGQQEGETSPSTRGERTQDATALPNKNPHPKPPAQRCCHKRRSTGSGPPRRTKRLRNQ